MANGVDGLRRVTHGMHIMTDAVIWECSVCVCVACMPLHPM